MHNPKTFQVSDALVRRIEGRVPFVTTEHALNPDRISESRHIPDPIRMTEARKLYVEALDDWDRTMLKSEATAPGGRQHRAWQPLATYQKLTWSEATPQAYKTALLLLGLPQSECRKFGQELADWIADRHPTNAEDDRPMLNERGETAPGWANERFQRATRETLATWAENLKRLTPSSAPLPDEKENVILTGDDPKGEGTILATLLSRETGHSIEQCREMVMSEEGEVRRDLFHRLSDLQQTGAEELQDVLELQRYTFNIRVTRQCLRFIRTTHLGLTFEHASEPRDMPNRFWKWPDEETDAERRSNEPRIDWRPFYDELRRAKDRLRTVWEQIAQDYGLLEAEYLLPAGSAVRATLVVNALNTIRLSNRMTKETDPELKAVGDQLATQVDYAAGDGGIYSLMRV